MFRRSLGWVLLVAIAGSGCAIDASAVVSTPVGLAAAVDDSTSGALPVIGPAPGSSHWHAGYAVRICDDVLAPFTAEDDPLGIHSHSDGMIHVHPFFVESGFEQARLSLFADAVGVELGDGRLELPNGEVWSDGDLCDGVPGQVFVDKWPTLKNLTESRRYVNDLDELRFEADGELYTISFAPVDSIPVLPDAHVLVPEVSNLAQPGPEWLSIDPAGAGVVQIWEVAQIGVLPCSGDEVAQRVELLTPSCFTPVDAGLAGPEAVAAARAVTFNRMPAVELTITPLFRDWLAERIDPTAADPLVWAIAIDGEVVTAPAMLRLPASPNRVIISGGMSVESATQLAVLLDG